MTSCPVCKGESAKVYRKAKRVSESPNYSVTKPTYGAWATLFFCKGCGVIFVYPLPSQEELTSLYGKMEDKAYLEEETMRREMAGRGLSFIEKYAPRKGRLLDVGCFAGFFLDVARHRGWEGVGIEPSAWGRKVAEERFSLPVLGATLEEASFPASSFDAVVLVDTLEHLRDPRSTLEETRRILKPGGILYVSTPDVGSLTARLLRNRWWGFRPEHLVYFSKKSLNTLLKETGFSILSRRSFQRLFTGKAPHRRLKEVSPVGSCLVSPLIRLFQLERHHFIVNFFDQIELVAERG